MGRFALFERVSLSCVQEAPVTLSWLVVVLGKFIDLFPILSRPIV
jgi:hypothetical protein